MQKILVIQIPNHKYETLALTVTHPRVIWTTDMNNTLNLKEVEFTFFAWRTKTFLPGRTNKIP